MCRDIQARRRHCRSGRRRRWEYRPRRISLWCSLLSLPTARRFCGPKAAIWAAFKSSARPATRGASGPMTTKSIALSRQKLMTASWSAMSTAIFLANVAMPPLPGAQYNVPSSGLCAIFQASACSRPPDPRTRILRFSLIYLSLKQSVS